MFRNPIQEKLQEMEEIRPSSSFEAPKPTLMKRVELFSRRFRPIKQVPQRSSLYGSIEDRVNHYSRAVEIDGHTGDANSWLSQSFQMAMTGVDLGSVQRTLRTARGREGYAGDVSEHVKRMLSEMYDEAHRGETDSHTATAPDTRSGIDDAINGSKQKICYWKHGLALSLGCAVMGACLWAYSGYSYNQYKAASTEMNQFYQERVVGTPAQEYWSITQQLKSQQDLLEDPERYRHLLERKIAFRDSEDKEVVRGREAVYELYSLRSKSLQKQINTLLGAAGGVLFFSLAGLIFALSREKVYWDD